MSSHNSHLTLIAIGALILFVATLLGAYGTQGIQGSVDEKTWNTYQVAVEYQFYHGLGLIVVGILAERFPKSKWISTSGWILFFGIVVFSGSIYVVTLTGMTEAGAMAPIGGLSIMGGWLALAYGILRER